MKILMVLTSHDQLGNTGRKTGFWLEEFAAPYFVFKDAGVQLTLVSPKGGQPPIDPKSDLPENQTSAMTRFKQDQAAQKALSQTIKLADVKAEDYDTVFYVGGHGPMWDLVDNPESIALIESFYNSGKPVAAVCHSPGVLHRVTYNGAPLVKGKRVTGFTNGEEETVHLTDVVPFLVEDELKRIGGHYEKAPDWQSFAITDGRLITGQNPASSTAAAQALLKVVTRKAATRYQGQANDGANEASVAKVDMKFEIVVVPVSDVDRAKEFYAGLGWRLDADYHNGYDFRVIQFTPPGSGCSVIFGKNVTVAAPGSAQGLYLIVADIEAARENLLRRGVKVSEVFHGADNVYAGPDEPYLFGRLRVNGPDPERRSYRSFASFSDPDGNGWLLQELTTRLPSRIDATATTFASADDLASAFRRAEAAHGEHEKRTGKRDANWPGWYAAYMVAEQSGKELPQ